MIAGQVFAQLVFLAVLRVSAAAPERVKPGLSGAFGLLQELRAAAAARLGDETLGAACEITDINDCSIRP